MTSYSTEQRTRKYVKGHEFLSFARNLSNKYGEILLDTTTKTELDALKTASKKLFHKTADATGDFAGKKIVDKITKPKPF